MKMLHRTMLCVAYRLLLVYWFIFRPTGGGAYVAVWHNGQILIVKNSYKSCWTFPAGGSKKDEAMPDTAVRELFEEVAIKVAPDELTLVDYFVSHSEYRTDRSAVFEIDFADRPQTQVDDTEVVEAKFVDFGDLTTKRYELACIAYQYVQWKMQHLSESAANS